MARVSVFLVAIIVLGGCAARLSPYAAVVDNERKQATELIKKYNDSASATKIDLLGSIPVRVYLEQLSPQEQSSVDCLVAQQCSSVGGVPVETVTELLQGRTR